MKTARNLRGQTGQELSYETITARLAGISAEEYEIPVSRASPLVMHFNSIR